MAQSKQDDAKDDGIPEEASAKFEGSDSADDEAEPKEIDDEEFAVLKFDKEGTDEEKSFTAESDVEEDIEVHPEVLAAARKIQSRYRIKIARRRIMDVVRNKFELVFDPDSGEYFYYNKETGESQWDKPKTLGDKDMYADGPEADNAARILQNAFRRRLALKQIREMIKGIYKKEYDPSTGDFYYLNVKTGETRWDKPGGHLLAVDEDIELDEDSNLLLQRDKEIDRMRLLLQQKELEIEAVQKKRYEELEEEERSKRLVTALRGAKRSKDMDEWTMEHVCAWFMELGNKMDQYCNAIVDKEIDGLLLLNMEEQDLEELGITSKLHQRRVEVGLRKYKIRYQKKQDGEEIDSDDDDSGSASETPSELLEEDEDERGDEEQESEADSDDELIPTEAEMLEIRRDNENMEFKIKFPGNNIDFPKYGDIVRCHFQVFLLDGTLIESSRKKRKRPFEFVVGIDQVIPGWDRAMLQMSKYERRLVTLSAEYSYGEAGYPPLIPPDVGLKLDIELIDFRQRPYWNKKLIQAPGLSEKPYYAPPVDHNDAAKALAAEDDGEDGDIEDEGDGGY